MVNNHWLEKAMTVCENELILVKSSATTKDWYNRMPQRIPAIYPSVDIPDLTEEDLAPILGEAHHLRMTRFGIEGVLKLPKKYHRLPFHVLYNNTLQPNSAFWVVLY